MVKNVEEYFGQGAETFRVFRVMIVSNLIQLVQKIIYRNINTEIKQIG